MCRTRRFNWVAVAATIVVAAALLGLSAGQTRASFFSKPGDGKAAAAKSDHGSDKNRDANKAISSSSSERKDTRQSPKPPDSLRSFGFGEKPRQVNERAAPPKSQPQDMNSGPRRLGSNATPTSGNRPSDNGNGLKPADPFRAGRGSETTNAPVRTITVGDRRDRDSFSDPKLGERSSPAPAVKASPPSVTRPSGLAGWIQEANKRSKLFPEAADRKSDSQRNTTTREEHVSVRGPAANPPPSGRLGDTTREIRERNPARKPFEAAPKPAAKPELSNALKNVRDTLATPRDHKETPRAGHRPAYEVERFRGTRDKYSRRSPDWYWPDRNNHRLSGGFFIRIGNVSLGYTNRDHCRFASPVWQGGRYYYHWPSQVFPCHYGYYAFEYTPDYCRPAVYCYYGMFPYILRDRVAYVERTVVRYQAVPVVIDNNYDYYLSAPSSGSVGRALDDIGNAWLASDVERLARHVRDGEKIAVYFDGEYSYSVDGQDYLDMTRDATERFDTISFEFTRISRRASDEISAIGEHQYYNDEGDKKIVYVSYTLRKHGTQWLIAEVGSSPNPY